MIYSLEGVSKFFIRRHARVPALQGVSFDVPRGEQVALLGQSGAGKTTLFRLLNGTLRPSGGHLRFEGREVSTMSGQDVRGMRRRIGTVYQLHHLVPSLNALENTLCGALGHWSLLHTVRNMIHPTKSDLERAMHSLELVGLAEKRQARADELSGGQQQRLAIARVLMQEPDVILADEPVASLDPALAEDIISLLTRIASDGKRTLLVALHAVELALRNFPRIVALRGGCVSFDAPARDVRGEHLETLYASNAGSRGETRPSRPGDDDYERKLRCIR